MYARMNSFQADASDGFEKSLRVAEEQVLPPLRQVEGSVGIVVLGDRQTGKLIGLTLWASEQAMKASEQTASRLRDDSAAAAGEELIGVERFEVLLEERWG